jgi:hypothetical protein
MSSSKRDWSSARAKLDAEGGQCRICRGAPVDPAHIIARSRVRPEDDSEHNIVPLCRDHHRAYDEGDLDLLPHLSAVEQSCAVLLAGGMMTALRRTTNSR